VVFVKSCDGMGTSNSRHKGAQGGAWVVRGGGWGTQTWERKKKKKVTYLNLHQNATCSSVLCVHCQHAGRQFVGGRS